MALVTICGFPSSGKSTRARELESFLSSKISASAPGSSSSRLKIQTISDESLALSKLAYNGEPPPSEPSCCPSPSSEPDG